LLFPAQVTVAGSLGFSYTALVWQGQECELCLA